MLLPASRKNSVSRYPAVAAVHLYFREKDSSVINVQSLVVFEDYSVPFMDTGAEIQYRRIVHRRFVLIRSVRYKEKIGISVGIEFHRYFSFLVRRDYKFYGVLPDSSALDAIDSGTDLSRTEIFGCGHPHFQRFAEVVLGQCKRHCIP